MSSSTERRWAEVDGIRGLLSIIVVVGHTSVELGVYAFASMQSWYWMPMDVFFVISGFLLGRIVVANSGQPGFLKSYFVRRILRIWPAYFSVVLTVSLATLLLGMNGGAPSSPWTTPGFVKQIMFLQFVEYYALDERGEYLRGLLHTWSVAVEEHFYILLPLFVFFLRKRSVPVIVAALAAAVLVAVVLRVGLNMHAWVLATRLHSFALGLLLAFMTLWADRGMAVPIQSRRLVTAAGVVALVALFVTPVLPLPSVLRWMCQSLAAAGFAAFMLAGIYQTSLAGGRGIPLLRNRALTHLGEISYSTYLWHWPLMNLLRPWALESGWSEPLLVSAVLVLVFIVANASYYAVEKPFLRLKHLWAYRPEKRAPEMPAGLATAVGKE